MRKVTLVISGLVLLAGGLTVGRGLAALCLAQAPSPAAEVDPRVAAFLKPVEILASDDPLRQKLKERHNVAVRMLDESVSEYKKGIRDASVVFEAARLTGDAKLALADTPEARAAVLEQLLGIAQLIESRLEEQLKKGFGSKSDLERARYARLTLEIELIRAKGHEPAKP